MVRTITHRGNFYALPYADMLKPLSLEERAELRESIKAHGILQPVTINKTYEVIDGAHRLEIASELNIDCPMQVLSLADPDAERTMALELNTARRQITPEEMSELRKQRIERVKAAREDGKSTRQIAHEEKVSQTQVLKDLQTTSDANGFTSGEHQCSPENPTPEITGRDGKSYPASKPKILCPRCTRLGNPVKNCPQCKEVREEAKRSAAEEKRRAKREAKKDAGALGAMKETNAEIESFCRSLMTVVKEQLPEDVWLNADNIREGAIRKFQDGCEMLRTKKCAALCPRCDGTGDGQDPGTKCRPCRGSGRVPKAILDQMVQAKN